ncbi:unnamed protein product [Rhizoctonia solani]|uniref:Uncharacterized protein n=1 Tax=Rhizoctonia solani TaxID=456999 RepID=A0A8H3H0H7_9AGAM|nr:unnamed protein product [Rhizoctonia solani]
MRDACMIKTRDTKAPAVIWFENHIGMLHSVVRGFEFEKYGWWLRPVWREIGGVGSTRLAEVVPFKLFATKSALEGRLGPEVVLVPDKKLGERKPKPRLISISRRSLGVGSRLDPRVFKFRGPGSPRRQPTTDKTRLFVLSTTFTCSTSASA